MTENAGQDREVAGQDGRDRAGKRMTGRQKPGAEKPHRALTVHPGQKRRNFCTSLSLPRSTIRSPDRNW